MKTLREILLGRHRSAEPQLNAIREEVLREQLQAGRPQNRTAASDAGRPWDNFVRRMWLELVWSCRHFWLGLGAVWVVILTLQFLAAEPQASAKSDTTPLSPSVLAILREQRRLAAELTEPLALPGVDKPSKTPRPRSDRSRTSRTFA